MPSLYLTPSFRRSLKQFTVQDRKRTTEAVEDFYDFLMGKPITMGLGFKKLATDIFEFRVDIHLRVVGIVEDDRYYLNVVGSHDQVRRFLRQRR